MPSEMKGSQEINQTIKYVRRRAESQSPVLQKAHTTLLSHFCISEVTGLHCKYFVVLPKLNLYGQSALMTDFPVEDWREFESLPLALDQ